MWTQGVLADEEGPLQVDSEHPVPLAGVELIDRASPGDAGGVEHGVEPAVAGNHAFDGGRHRVLVADVDLEVGPFQVQAEHGRPLRLEAFRARLAEPRRRPGDERHFSGQPVHSASSRSWPAA